MRTNTRGHFGTTGLLGTIGVCIAVLLGTVTAVAGPKGAAGDLYVCNGWFGPDFDSIIQVDSATGAIVGAFVTGLDFPRDAQFGPDGRLYVVDGGSSNGKVTVFDGNSGAFIKVLISGLDDPTGLRFEANGNLLVYEFDNQNIKEFDISTGSLIGIFATGLDGDNAPMNFGPDGNLYVSNLFGGTIQRFAPDGTDLGIFASGGSLWGPESHVFGPNGNLFVSSTGGNTIVEFDGTTGALIGDFINTNLIAPLGIAFAPNGNVWVANWDEGFGGINEFDGTTGEWIQEAPDVFMGATTITVKPDPGKKGAVGDLYVCDGGSHSIIQVNSLTGAVVGTFATVPGRPVDVQFGTNGNLFVADLDNGAITEHDGDTGTLIRTVISGLDHPSGIRFEANGNLLVFTGKDIINNTIEEYDIFGNFIRTFATGLSGDDAPMDFGPDGNLYVSNFLGGFVQRFDADGNDLGVFTNGGSLNGPENPVFGPNGNLFVSSFYGDTVVEYHGTTGALIGDFINTNLFEPGGIAFAPNGNVWVANWDDGSGKIINEFDGTTGVWIRQVTGFNGPLAITVKPEKEPDTCLTMTVSPLIAGEDATWNISGADPGARVVVVNGLVAGSTTFIDESGFCATFGIEGIEHRSIVGRTIADGSGRASIVRYLLRNLFGITVLTQAAEQGTCPDECMSNVDTQVIQ